MKNPIRPHSGLVLLLLFALTACARPDEAVIARELYGRWETDAPEYAGRGFVLTADSITLHQGGGIRVRYAIETIRRTERGTHTDYALTYRGIVSSLDFPLEYRVGEAGADLRFPNQQRVVWRRVTESTLESST
jgi:hypothetical protein